MYIPLSRKLAHDFKIVHVAYSGHEQAKLRAAGITDGVINFKHEVAARLALGGGPDPALLERIDALFVAQTEGRFTLNGSIQSDRGFSLLGTDEALVLCQAYYAVWDEILVRHAVDYVMHEPVSLLMNHMCSVLCAKYGALYLFQVMTLGKPGQLSYLNITGDDYVCPEINAAHARYAGAPALIDRARCEQFLDKFRSSFNIFLGDTVKPTTSYLGLYLRSVKHRVKRMLHMSKLDRMTDNIDYWEMTQDAGMQRLDNMRQYKRRISYDAFVPAASYYYYSMHLEPEAVVLYLAGGWYANQTKLIENIAAQLPIGCLLYVKDHPHVIGYRSVADYERLQAVPNVKLLEPTIPGKLVMKDAIGVFTINGTAGFEGVLLNKQVYTFGNTFYGACARVHHVRHIRELRALLYAERAVRHADDDTLMAFVMAYLDSVHEGMVDYFVGRAASYGIDLDRNIDNIARDLVAFSKKF
ncbi:MAG: hypothetical protein V4857_28260 [Pseudomonadota bacterium]